MNQYFYFLIIISVFKINALRQFRIELWPGYSTSIRNHQKDILLNCDLIHKVMRTDTVYDLLQDVHRDNPESLIDVFTNKVLGITVLTKYNNHTYRIDDVDFKLSPRSTFKRGESEMTIKEYYETVNSNYYCFAFYKYSKQLKMSD